MARPTIILTRDDVAGGLDPQRAVADIEQAMGAYEKGRDYLPPKSIYDMPMLGEGAGVAACIVGYTDATRLLSMKVGQERRDNLTKNLPSTNSWLLLFDVETGELLMICDGTLPTMLRTAAAAAAATKCLARAEARVLAVIGAGQLGRQCVRLTATVRPFEKILIHDQSSQFAEKLVGDLSAQIDRPLEIADAATACREADVIVTATTSREPIVMAQWVRPGAHLSCMGSDLADKIECEPALLPACRIFADEPKHAVQRGEVSRSVLSGLLDEMPYAGTLGQVINGDVPGRTDEKQITMYDGVGIGIQDTTIARTIYDQARAGKLGTCLAFS